MSSSTSTDEHEIETTTLLRGTEGFGVKHQLHTDRLLSLSEDLPVVSVAVDTRARIEGVLTEVAAIKQRGLLTLERARLLSGELDQVTLAERPAEETKLTVYLGRRQRTGGGEPAFAALCDLLHRRGLDGATVLLGVDGTARGQRQRARFFARNAAVPMMLIAVGSGERIGRALPELGEIVRQPLLTLERVTVCKRDGQLLARPPAVRSEDDEGMAIWQKLMVYTAESAAHGGHPIHSELVRRLRTSGVAGATSIRGVWGFHGDHPPHGDRLLGLRRRVPVVTVVIDRPEQIAAAFEIVDELTAETGLVTSELIPAMASMSDGGSRRGGFRLARTPGH